MGLVVAILITLAVAGSILWVMPSPRDKRIIAMRQRAMELGLKVRLPDQQLAAKFFPWVEDHRRYVLYELYFPAAPGKNKTEVLRLSPDFEPHELDNDYGLRARISEVGGLDALPASAEAMILYSGAVSLLWTEQEGLEVLEPISDSLRRCKKAML